MKRRTQPGIKKRIVVEIGPFVMHGFGKASIAHMERKMRDEIDERVRSYMSVGPYSKAVRTRIEEVES